MAIDYTELFTHIGKCVYHINNSVADETAVLTDIQDVADEFEATDDWDLLTPYLTNAFDPQRAAFKQTRQQLANLVTRRLQKDDLVYDELNLDTNNVKTVLAALAKQMVVESKTLDASTVTLGSVTANGSNTGNATIVVDKGLDGITPPGTGLTALIENRGFDSELIKTDDLLVECTTDKYRTGATSGRERYQLSGEQSFGSWAYDEGGSGPGRGLQSVLDLNKIPNGEFTTITSHIPDSWTRVAGTAGTHIQLETTEFYRGSQSVEYGGDASLAAITMTVPPTGLQQLAGKRVIMGMRYKASATQTSSQELRLNISGTGYTPGSTEKIVILGDVFSTSWALSYVVFNLPLTLPSDSVMTLSLAGTPATTKKVWINQVFLAPVQFHGGFNVNVVPGSTDPKIGDRWTFSVTNNTAGLFSDFFREAYGVQLPTENTGSETISDALVA